MSVCTVALIASLVTIRLSPVAWQDEVQILDYGRTLLPGSDLTTGLSLDASGIAIRPISYLGCVASELAFRLCGSDMIGPRLLSIIGAIAAATMLFGYLRTRTASAWLPLLLAAAFLLDPLLAEGYRGARCDSWVMALMLAACWILRAQSRGQRSTWSREAVCGVLVALAAVTWVSALLLLPLVVLELYESSRRGASDALGTALLAQLRVASWSAVALLVLMLPYWEIIPEMVNATLKHSGQVMGAGKELTAVLNGLVFPFTVSPFLPLAGTIALVVARQWKLAAAAAVALTLICMSGPYGHRDVYLEPYLVIAVAVALQSAKIPRRSLATFLAFTLAAALVAWPALVTLGARNVNAILNQRDRNPGAPLTLLRSCLGETPRTVYVGAWRAYYAVRQLGWRYVRPFQIPSVPVDSETVGRLLAQCDVVLIDPTAKTQPATPSQIAEAGFEEAPCEGVAPEMPFKIYVRPARQ